MLTAGGVLAVAIPVIDGNVAHAQDPTSLVATPVPPGGGTVRYQLPASSGVRRVFEPPAVAFGSGHRGVDLDLRVGAVVRAAADGTVTHAGPIAGTTWIAIAHGDGVVTSYGPVGATHVSRGQDVRGGQPIGVLAAGGHGAGDQDDGLHWGARLAGSYIDPMDLLDQGVPRPSLIGAGVWGGADHAVRPYPPWDGGQMRGWTYAPSPKADRPGFAVAPNPNHLVMLSGLGSSSASVPIDPAHLGYDTPSVTLFSYAGRTRRASDPADLRRDQLPFDASDTAPGVDAAARRLHEQLRAQARREPGRAVDLIGHSMGGVVILKYLAHHHDAYDPQLPPIGHVVTIASPLQGSDLAVVATDVGSHSIVGPVVSGLHGLVSRLRPDRPLVPMGAPAIKDLATGSAFMRELATGWDDALHAGPAGPLAMGTRVLTIGGGSDRIVGASRTAVPQGSGLARDHHDTDAGRAVRIDGEALRALGVPAVQPWADGPPLEHRILPGGHQEVLASEAVREVVWRFLAGQEVVASPGRLAHLISEESGITLRLSGHLVRLHDLVWQPLRPAAFPPATVGNRGQASSRDHRPLPAVRSGG